MTRNLYVQMAIIVLLALVFGVMTNATREDPLDWIAKKPTIEIVDPDTTTLAPQDTIPKEVDPNLPSWAQGIGSELGNFKGVSLKQIYTDIYQNEQGVLIDSRYASEYEAGHIAGAVSIPYDEVMDHLDQIAAYPLDTLIVVYCDGSGCDSSYMLAEELINLGYTKIFVFVGGWIEWQEAGYPVE